METIRKFKNTLMACIFAIIILLASIFVSPVLFPPTPSTGAVSFGYETIGGSSTSIEGGIRGSMFTLTEIGTADSITAAISVTTASHHVKCAIYKHSDLSLVNYTEDKLVEPQSVAWVTFNFGTPKATLAASTEYILVAWAAAVSGDCSLYRSSGDTDQGHYEVRTFDGFPTTLTVTHTAYKYSIFCNYSSTADTTPPTISDVAHNMSAVNMPCLFSAKATDNVALSGYYFSTNNSGTWTNTTFQTLSGASAWMNQTATLTPYANITVGYRWFINDTSNNWFASSIYAFTTELFRRITINSLLYTEIAINEPMQTKVVFANGWFWTFWSNGAGVQGTGNAYMRAVSEDLTTALGTVTLGNCSTGSNLAVFYNDSHISVLMAKSYVNNSYAPCLFRLGEPLSNGTMSWIADWDLIETLDENGTARTAQWCYTLTADTNGYVWLGTELVCEPQGEYTDGAPFAYIIRNEAKNGSWITNGTYSHRFDALGDCDWYVLPEPLTNGKLYVFYVRNWCPPNGQLWNGTAWGTKEENFSDAGIVWSKYVTSTALGDQAHLAWSNDSSKYDGWYAVRDYATGNWTSEHFQNVTVSMVLCGNAQLDYLFWVNSTKEAVYYRTWQTGGWGDETVFWDVLGNASSHVVTQTTISRSWKADGGYVCLLVLWKSAQPYSVELLVYKTPVGTQLTAGLPWNSVTPWNVDVGKTLGEVNASLNLDGINWAVIAIDYGNGTQWSLTYGISYNSEKLVASTSNILYIYCNVAGYWWHTYP
jgi:hypothetical protein